MDWVLEAKNSNLSPEAFSAMHPELRMSPRKLRYLLETFRKRGSLPADGRTLVKTRKPTVMVALVAAIIRAVFMLPVVGDRRMRIIMFLLVWTARYYPEHVPCLPGRRSVELFLSRLKKTSAPASAREKELRPLAKTIIERFIHLASFESNRVWAIDSYCLTKAKQRRMHIKIVDDHNEDVEPCIVRVICCGSRIVLSQVFLTRRPKAKDIIRTIHHAFQGAKSIYQRALRPTFIRMDRAGEHIKAVASSGLSRLGIIVQLTPPATPSLNGVCERVHRTLGAGIRCQNRDGESLELNFRDLKGLMNEVTSAYHHRRHLAFGKKTTPALASSCLPNAGIILDRPPDEFMYLDSRPLQPRNGNFRHAGTVFVTTCRSKVIVREYVAGKFRGERQILAEFGGLWRPLDGNNSWEEAI